MSKPKAASLTSGFIATKGAAAPSAEAPINPAPINPAPNNPVPGADAAERTAVTVRLTGADYRRLKLYGLEHRQSNQEIIVAALCAYLTAK